MDSLIWNIIFLFAGIVFGGWMMCAQPLHAQTYQGGHPPSNYGGQYHGLPATIGQTMDQEIQTQTQYMEAGMGMDPMMSYEAFQAQRDIENCEFFKYMIFPFTLGLSTLYNCHE